MEVTIDVKVRAPSGSGSGCAKKLIKNGTNRGAAKEKMKWRIVKMMFVITRTLYTPPLAALRSCFFSDRCARCCSRLQCNKQMEMYQDRSIKSETCIYKGAQGINCVCRMVQGSD